ncbi:MAG: hypothetical protein HOK28_11190, partial [Deltaproteobacteria bacterium]|nr:hypothetical protein [Deltaproteobacteria bacterium]
MNLICPACQWSSSSPPKRVVITGNCPSCSGQVWLEAPSPSDIFPSLVAMSFEPGSNLAQKLVAFHRETPLVGVPGPEQAVPQEIAEGSREILSAAILPAPPVVNSEDGAATGVFKLPEMPSLSSEGDLTANLTDVVVVVGETTLSTGDSQEVDLDDLGVELWADSPAPASERESTSFANVPLPELPAFSNQVANGTGYNDFVEFNVEPVVVDQSSASWMSAFLMGSLSLGLVLCAFSYGQTLAQWRTQEIVIPPPTRHEMAMDVWAQGLQAVKGENPAAAMKLMEEFLSLGGAGVEVDRVRAVAALKL